MYYFIITHCIACNILMQCHPDFVPSITVKGKKEALCKNCFDKWNEIHRISKGLEPIPLHKNAYNYASDDEF